jgi:SAM-dependent methyltransferase
MIKFILNRVPRGVLQRIAGWAMPIAGLWYAIGRGRKGSGHGVECPLCGARYRKFMPYGYVEERKNALCPRCLALERHRLLWLRLERETDLRSQKHGMAVGVDARSPVSPKFLHIAPEVCLSKKFEKLLPKENYITADLESPLAKVHLDVQNIPFPDATFDIVFCNHVLEHVPDDRLAMREMHRVMKPGGWGVMLSPVDENRAETFEDDTVTDPAERTRLFGQYDHRRVYGRDYADRLRETGWEVEEINYFEKLPHSERTRYALRPETLYIVRRRQ